MITLYLGEGRRVYAVFVFTRNERADLSPQHLLLRLVEDIKSRARTRRRR